MQKIICYYIFISLLLIGCNNNKENRPNDDTSKYSLTKSITTEDEEISSSEANYSDIDEKYPDGTYNAEVEYYNPNTGTKSTYTLSIVVESNEIIQINFSNGGWIDNSHFSGAELDENGYTSFTTVEGYEYEVQIIDE